MLGGGSVGALDGAGRGGDTEVEGRVGDGNGGLVFVFVFEFEFLFELALTSMSPIFTGVSVAAGDAETLVLV